ncbi:MAG: hypothetical protein Greene041679_462 [Parcubacteria group bacterium Greene0416_79]|nr:MAG: hypothetical protein Greene041679_462 [Parcubacteria group bacterium Greene0416_79]
MFLRVLLTQGDTLDAHAVFKERLYTLSKTVIILARILARPAFIVNLGRRYY